jgi:hypothetical protein
VKLTIFLTCFVAKVGKSERRGSNLVFIGPKDSDFSVGMKIDWWNKIWSNFQDSAW